MRLDITLLTLLVYRLVFTEFFHILRFKSIPKSINRHNDALYLQEVETDQFYNFFLPELKSEGYDGIFSPKSRAKTMGESERKYVDGCAIFFRSAK